MVVEGSGYDVHINNPIACPCFSLPTSMPSPRYFESPVGRRRVEDCPGENPTAAIILFLALGLEPVIKSIQGMQVAVPPA